MSAIRCEYCPFSDIDNGVTVDRCVHPDVGEPRDAEGGRLSSAPLSTRPLWCPRRRDASKRCRACGEVLDFTWSSTGRCPRCTP